MYVIGLSERVANVETLRRADYFGRFGRIVKVVVCNPLHPVSEYVVFRRTQLSYSRAHRRRRRTLLT